MINVYFCLFQGLPGRWPCVHRVASAKPTAAFPVVCHFLAQRLPFCYRGSLADGHVCIVPADHVASARRTDEAVWNELRNFKKSLLQMFMQQVRLRVSACLL